MPSGIAAARNRMISGKLRSCETGAELAAPFRHAVEAANVAAIGDADSQIVVHAVETVDQGPRAQLARDTGGAS